MKKEYGRNGFFIFYNLYFSDLILNKGMQHKMNNADLSDNNMKHGFADPTTKSDSKMKLELRGDGGGRVEDIGRMMREVTILSIRRDLRTVTKCLPHHILHSECSPNQL